MRKNERIGTVEVRGMKLQKLLAGVDVVKITGASDAEILSVAYDSRRSGREQFSSRCGGKRRMGLSSSATHCSAAPSRSQVESPRPAEFSRWRYLD